jgi:hypothetical protein
MSQSRHSRRIVPIIRSHNAFICGVRGADFSTVIPKAAIERSSSAEKMQSRS